MSSSNHRISVPYDRAIRDPNVGHRGTRKPGSSTSKSGKARHGHVKEDSNKAHALHSSSKKNKSKWPQIPRVSSPKGTHASPTMASGSFTSYQALPYGHVDNGTAYGSVHQLNNSVSQAGNDPAAVSDRFPMDRWLNESRQDEPFRAFTMDTNKYSGDVSHDSLSMTCWLDQSRRNEPFSVFTMTNGNYSDDVAAEADFDPLLAGYTEEVEEGDI
ncbi:hypothetical protein PG989_002833 [Apiospora arundinis]